VRNRQPIGGDLGISRPVSLDHNVEETDLADFGIVVYMTRTAIV